MKVLLSDIAYTIRGDVISEEDIYKHLKKGGIPVYSSNTKNNGLIGEINNSFYQKLNAKGFKGEITWTTDGNAGNFILRDKKFVFTNVCGKIKIKKEWKNKILPQWLALFLNIESKKYLTSKGGNPKLMKEQVDNIQIVIPNLQEQENLIKEFILRSRYIKELHSIKSKIEMQFKKKISFPVKKYLIRDLFEITSGVRITQFDIYKNPGTFPVVTSQTSNEGIAWYGDKKWLEEITKNGKKVIIDKTCLTWTKDGAKWKCGTIFYRDYKFYPNDHCGVLIPKVDLNLNWFKVYAQHIFYQNVVAQDSQGMLYEEQMANIEVEIPVKENGEIDIDLQNEIYAEYKRLSDIKEKLESLINKYSL